MYSCATNHAIFSTLTVGKRMSARGKGKGRRGKARLAKICAKCDLVHTDTGECPKVDTEDRSGPNGAGEIVHKGKIAWLFSILIFVSNPNLTTQSMTLCQSVIL